MTPLLRSPVLTAVLCATLSTLFFVPVMYSLLRRQPPREILLEEG